MEPCAPLLALLLDCIGDAGLMKDVVVVVEVSDGDCVRAGREGEVLVYRCAGIAPDLDAVVPDLRLAYRHGFSCLSDDVDRGCVEDFVDCGRDDLDAIHGWIDRVGD